MTEDRGGGVATGLLVGGLGGAALAAAIAALVAARPAEAAPPDEKLDYVIEVLTTLVPLLAEVAESNASLTAAIQQWLVAQGVPPAGAEGVVVTVFTPWAAREPEEIYRNSIRSAGTFYTDLMVDWTRGKRLLFKVESSLDQAVQIQVIGNKDDTRNLATDVGPALPCSANGNLSVGPAWDDWHPYIGMRITVAVAPTSGILNIWSAVQE